MHQISISDDWSIDRKLKSLLAFIELIGLQSPLHVFELQLRQCQDLTSRTKRRQQLDGYIKTEEFTITMGSILLHPLLKGVWSGVSYYENGGGTVLDTIMLPHVCIEMEAEISALGRQMWLPIKEVTPESLLSFDLAKTEKHCRKEAPRLWRMLEKMGASTRTTKQGPDQKQDIDSDSSDDDNSDSAGEAVGDDGGGNRRSTRNGNGKRANGGKRKDRGMMVTMVLAILSYIKTNRANRIQVIMGYYLLSAHVPKRAIAVLSRLGFCVSYESITRIVKRISGCLQKEYRKAVRNNTCVWVWDNLNQMYRVKTRLMSHKDHLSHETQPFIAIIDKSVGLEEQLKDENIQRDRALKLAPEDLVPNYEETAETIKPHIFDVFYHYFRDKGMGKVVKEDGRPTIKPVDPISPIIQTKLYPLPTLRLNEGRIDETISVIEAIEREIGTDGDYYADGKLSQFIAGDFVTVRNTLRALYQRTECIMPGDSKGYIEPFFGPLHYRMATQAMIQNNHWGRGDGKDIASLEKFQILLGDNKVDKRCKDFRRVDFFHADLLDGFVLAFAMELLGLSTMKELGEWFADGENDWKALIEVMAKQLFDPLIMQKRRFDPESGEPRAKTRPGPIGFHPSTQTTNSASTPSGYVRDVTLDNAMLFTRDLLVERELIAAIKHGDPGRLMNCVRYFGVMFQGTSQFNYAMQSIHLIACYDHIWDDKAKAVWKNTVLVNPSGIPGKSVGVDNYNEFLIKDGKEMVRPWTNQLSDTYNKTHLVRQLPTMKAVKKMILKTTGAVDYKDTSQLVNRAENVEIVVRELMKDHVFRQSKTPRERCRGNDNSLLSEAKDLVLDGLRKIATGEPISKYLSSARCSWSEDASFFAGEEGEDDDDHDNW